MTKQSVVVPAEAATMPLNTAPLLPYPPPRAAPPVVAALRKKYLHAQQVDLGVGAGRIGGWVESMRASSPTHARAAAGVDEERAAWMVKHPSALDKFEQVVAASKGKQIVVFLDYDGTLSPIVDDPDAAYIITVIPTRSSLTIAHCSFSGGHTDAEGGPERRQALPDGDRQRAVPRQGVRVREAGGALLRRQPRHGHQGPCEILPALQGQGETGSLSAGERVPAHDRAGARISGRKDRVHTWSQGGEQQVLRVCPLQTRRRKELGHVGGHGEVRAEGLPEAEADAGADGVRGAADHQVGQGQGPGVPARVAGVRRLQRRPTRVHRRRPHRRGRVQRAAQARPGRRHPRVQAPQGDQRVLLPAGARRGDGVPAASRGVGAPHQVPPQVVISSPRRGRRQRRRR